MRSRTGGHAEAVAWDSWPLRAREGACRGSMDAPFDASCGGRAGGEPLADLAVIVDWERGGSVSGVAFAFDLPCGLSLSGSRGGLAATPFVFCQVLPMGMHELDRRQR